MRLRVSSQSLKRAWRTSEVFQSALGSNVGTRTKDFGVEVFQNLKDKGVEEDKAKEYAKSSLVFSGNCRKQIPKSLLRNLELSNWSISALKKKKP